MKEDAKGFLNLPASPSGSQWLVRYARFTAAAGAAEV
eukprot:CAMPEP_0116036026 /NCGR_PEP_ID=MMETSP0321-20121206/20848_1 /TAXON_ID=163516 /ORGANISM="Leptocylindrus danicus var. danicus, Strain B650" /LENGTH=36 /DNA_ID= /DNA_START= /DNA_END= /DNA_ORIENTATION=